MAKRLKKILAVLFTICLSTCILALVAACGESESSNVSTGNLPTPMLPDENGGGGGGGGGGPGGGPKQGTPVDTEDLPAVADDDKYELNGPEDAAITVTFTDTFQVTWTDADAGSYLLKIGGDTVAQTDPMRSCKFYVSYGEENDWVWYDADDHGPVSVGVNPTETTTITIIVEGPAGVELTCTGVAFSNNGQG